jgi:hypothetical protein
MRRCVALASSCQERAVSAWRARERGDRCALSSAPHSPLPAGPRCAAHKRGGHAELIWRWFTARGSVPLRGEGTDALRSAQSNYLVSLRWTRHAAHVVLASSQCSEVSGPCIKEVAALEAGERGRSDAPLAPRAGNRRLAALRHHEREMRSHSRTRSARSGWSVEATPNLSRAPN